MEGNTQIWKWDVDFEQKRHPTFGNSTDEVSETAALLYETGLPKERRCKWKIAKYYIWALCCMDVTLVPFYNATQTVHSLLSILKCH
jgi:hypothetical protein